ncbi:uncharacterized protein CLUP02_05281 [Colletotrichum lupini]|uniref:Uncharacterized protein n=1 Tax=Colletotrichum lupini TaxID=145971 RepID=A0A9Q8SLY3_9PEZI|nr:uncharacterized protein CLUP02_05281 [Colletotrichum lupini]UQC79801.1 hypothetical protein CLUP02_05281 [Colletotrichum lupini]
MMISQAGTAADAREMFRKQFALMSLRCVVLQVEKINPPICPAGGAGPPSTRAAPDPVPEIFAGSTDSTGFTESTPIICRMMQVLRTASNGGQMALSYRNVLVTNQYINESSAPSAVTASTSLLPFRQSSSPTLSGIMNYYTPPAPSSRVRNSHRDGGYSRSRAGLARQTATTASNFSSDVNGSTTCSIQQSFKRTSRWSPRCSLHYISTGPAFDREKYGKPAYLSA